MRLSKIKVCTQNCWPATVTVIETNWSFKFLKKWWNTLFVDLFMLLHTLTYYEKKFCNVFVQRKHLIWFDCSIVDTTYAFLFITFVFFFLVSCNNNNRHVVFLNRITNCKLVHMLSGLAINTIIVHFGHWIKCILW